MTPTPWAILLCKFNDNAVEPHPRDFYEDLFTRSGAGQQNLTDAFADASHNSVDISQSRVFGWFTLDHAKSDYVGSGANPQGRRELVNWAKERANAAKIDLSAYFGIVVCTNVDTDLWGGDRTVVCFPGPHQPSVLVQEMGHGYGLDHSRRHGSAQDYQDQWDVMSTWDSVYMAPHPRWQLVGPGLNAWNMRGRGWLDETRVWKQGHMGSGFMTTVTLRPLHRADLPGFLSAELPDRYLVEFRMNEGWDSAIPRPAVLVHRFEGNRSYIMPGTAGNYDLTAGNVFEPLGPPLSWPGLDRPAYSKMVVTGIDPGTRTATVELTYIPATRLGIEFQQVLGGVSVDGGGWVIVGGKVVPVPPWDPLIRVLEELVVVQGSTALRSSETAAGVRREALQGIAELVQAELNGIQHISSPASLAAAVEEDYA